MSDTYPSTFKGFEWIAVGKASHDARYRRLLTVLADARRESGLSQAALADRLGRRQQFISKYEQGERRLDVIEFLDVAAALGCDAIQMLRGIDTASTPARDEHS